MATYNSVYIEASEHYQKKSYRNKCKLAGPNGVNQFSVPLAKGKHNATPIRDVRLSYEENWSAQFLKLCNSNYRKSPYYDFIIDEITTIFSRHHTGLFAMNMELLRWIIQFLELDIKIECTDSYNKFPSLHQKDLRESFKPSITLESPNQAYPQVFLDKHGFIPNLSILDLIFCCGRESVNYL